MKINKKIYVIIGIVVIVLFMLFNKSSYKQIENKLTNDIPYGNSTLKKAGGLLVCMKKATEILEFPSGDINEYVDYSIKNGYKLEKLGTDYRMIESYYQFIGLKVEQIARYDKEKIIENLKYKRPIIMLCGNGNFTTTGKYILIYNLNDNEHVKVFDPSDSRVSKMVFSIDYIINNSSMALKDEIAFWAISKE